MDEGVQKVQNSSYKISKSLDVMYRMVTLVNNPSTVILDKRSLRPKRCQAL